MIDLLFLTIFIVEISMRLYAWGFTYLRDVLNLVDMVIVLGSFVLLWITMEFTMLTCLDFSRVECTGASSGYEATRSILRVFRMVRIVRIVIIINKIKRSRENAQILRKKAKYKRQGSPVERVLEILQRLRRKAESGADRENLSFIMDAIISDQLYKVNVSAAETSGMTTEMSAFLLEGGAETNKSSKRAAVVGKVLVKAGTVSLSRSPKGKRSKAAPGETPPEGQSPATMRPPGGKPDYQPPSPSGGIGSSPLVERQFENRRASVGGLKAELAWAAEGWGLWRVPDISEGSIEYSA